MGSAGCTGSFWADRGLDQNTKFGTDKHNLVSKNKKETVESERKVTAATRQTTTRRRQRTDWGLKSTYIEIFKHGAACHFWCYSA